MHNTETAVKQKVARIASTIFLVVAILIAGMVSVNTFVATDATAYSEDVGTTSTICQTWFDRYQDCLYPKSNCLCEIIIEP